MKSLCVHIRMLERDAPKGTEVIVLKAIFEKYRKENKLLDRIITGETSCVEQTIPITRKILESEAIFEKIVEMGFMGESSKELRALIEIRIKRHLMGPDNWPDLEYARESAMEAFEWARSLDRAIQIAYDLPAPKEICFKDVFPPPVSTEEGRIVSIATLVILFLVSSFIAWIVWSVTGAVGTTGTSGVLMFIVMTLKAIDFGVKQRTKK